MSKYDVNFKEKVVNAYLAGEGGYTFLAKQFGVGSKTNIRIWVNTFKQFGKRGLENKKTNTIYSVQFKLDVLDYKLRTGDSFEKVALKFGNLEPSMVYRWLKIWQTKGMEGFPETRGHLSLLNKPNKFNTLKELTKEQQLQKEIELLKAENAYLKKLRASGVNIPSRMLKQNPESSMNSEKDSNQQLFLKQ